MHLTLSMMMPVALIASTLGCLGPRDARDRRMHHLHCGLPSSMWTGLTGRVVVMLTAMVVAMIVAMDTVVGLVPGLVLIMPIVVDRGQHVSYQLPLTHDG